MSLLFRSLKFGFKLVSPKTMVFWMFTFHWANSVWKVNELLFITLSELFIIDVPLSEFSLKYRLFKKIWTKFIILGHVVFTHYCFS